MNTTFTEEQIKEEIIRKRREYMRQWREKNLEHHREYMREYQKEYYKTPKGKEAICRATENYWRKKAIEELNTQNKEKI